MAREQLNIVVREDGSRTVKRNINDIGTEAKKASGGVQLLQKALAGLAVGATLVFLQRQADTYTRLTNQLKLVTSGTENLARINDELFASANRTYSAYDATAELYAKTARNAETLGLSQQELLSFTETVNQSIAITGTDAAQAAGGIRQLGQAIGSGELRGDELISILENMPRLAQAIADGMGVGIGQLREMGAAGELTAAQIVTAIQNQEEAISAEFAEMTPTIANTLTVLSNNVVRFVGQMNEMTGAGAAAGKVILFMADNLQGLAILAAGVGAALVWRAGFTAISGLLGPMIALQRALGATSVASALYGLAMKGATAATRSFTVALLANPFTAILVAITAVIAAIVAFGDEVSVTEDGAVSLKDAFFAALSLIGDFVKIVAAAFGVAWDYTIGAVTGLFDYFGVSASDVLGFILKVVVATVGTQLGVWIGAFRAIKAIWDNFPEFMDFLFTKVVNLAISAAELVVNAWQAPFRGLQALAGLIDAEMASSIGGALDAMTVELPRRELSEEAAAAGAAVGNAFMEGMAEGQALPGQIGDAIIARARQNASSENPLDGAGDPATLPGDADGSGSRGSDAAARATQTRAEMLEQLNDEMRRATDLAGNMNLEFLRVEEDLAGINAELASREFAELTADETAALRDKLVTMYEAQDLQDAMLDAYEDFAGPQRDYRVGQEAINAVMAEFPQYAEQGQRALRSLRIEYLQTKQDVASGLELGQLLVQEDLEDSASRVASAYQSEFGAVNDVWRDLESRATALRQLMQDDPINSGQYADRLRELGIEALILKGSLPDATFMDGLTAGFASFVADFQGLIPGLSNAWGQFFTTFADGFANSIGRAIVYGENLGQSLKEVARSAFAELISSVIKLGVQWLVMQVIGQAAMGAITATGAAAAGATAAAWAPAAAMVSLATFGANAGPAAAGIAITTGLAAAMAKTGGLAGFREGGYTGAAGVNDVAGVVHGQEYVFDANSVQRLGLPFLESLRSSRTPGYKNGGMVGRAMSINSRAAGATNFASGDGLNVTIEDHVGADIKVNRIGPNEVRVIAKEVAEQTLVENGGDMVSAELARPNSKTNKALSRHTDARPRR